jgi:ribosomal protein S18 acetylase RimI-like enzyme
LDVTLRPATGSDSAFFASVYASTRTEELAAVPWDDDTRAAFLASQFAAQSAHYEKNYAGATVDVIVVGGVDAGRLYVYRGEREIRIVDVSLLPEHRGGGAGTFLLERLMDEARESGRSLTIHVEKENPARSLYDRLGFVEEGDVGAYAFMAWRPSG